MSSDMPVGGKLGERPFELLPREVKGVVVDALARILESLQQQVDLSEIPETQNQSQHWALAIRGGSPAAELDHHSP